MTCPQCGQENSPEMRFCGACGSALSNSCPSCGFDNPPAFKFCGQCGTLLSVGSGGSNPTSDAPPAVSVIPGRGQPAPSSPQPTSFANGRYQVEKFLGEGGKKKVYLAHDATLDREVAFALIKTEGLDDTSRQRIQREAQAMGRLGSHPHIVTVFDLGDERDQPYMVTELMGGGDVEGLIEDSTGHRLPLEQAIKIAQETCHGLEFAHSRGVVHRDLKPGNVWLTSDGIAKIGDFGLAVALDRSRLTTEGMMVGTVSYMPPEQAMGGEVTPRSDLYSLGAMLYEMVTGRPPFLGDDSVAIIGQHINTPPVAPTWHNSDCPRQLDALILRLLAKDPAERPESASDVLAALEALDLQDVGAGLKPAPTDDLHSLDSLAGGVFVGRQREMGELKACLEDALSGRGRLVTLVGEPGIGKTRTAQELATYAGLRGAQVLWGRSYEEQGVPPYWPWVQAIRSYVRERDPEQLRSEMGSGAADIAEVVSDVRERLPGLPSAPQLEPEQARFRLFDSIVVFLRTASQRQPLVLVLDDLHWADQPSLMLLQFVARELGGARLLLIGTYRDMELSRQHPLAEALGELTRERLFQRVLLRGLAQEDVGRFIEMTSGNNAPRGLVEAVHTQTEGNPLFVTEVVRLLVQEGELGADPSSAAGGSGRTGEAESWTIRIPEGVREVIGRRLNRLSQRCNETLTVASILGREFTLAQLRPLVEEVTEDRLVEILEEALASRVIEELPQSVGRYQFTHALIQETLTAELSLTRRVRLHSRIALALEDLYGVDAESHAAELAHHFAQAEAVTGTDKLVQYSLLAGDRAMASFAWEEALAHFERAAASKIGQVPSPRSQSGSGQAMDAQMAAILFGLGRAQLTLLDRNEMPEAIATLALAFDYYAEAGDVDRAVAVAQSRYASRTGLRTGIAQLIARALSLVPADSHQAGGLLSRQGYVLGMEEGDHEAASVAFGRALAIARQEQDAALEMPTLAEAARVDRFGLHLPESLSKSRQAIELLARFDDPQVEAAARYEASVALCINGDPEEAQVHATAMLAAAERLRDRFWLSSALGHNAALCQVRGDWQAARDFAERGLAVQPGDSRILGRMAGLEYDLGNSDWGEKFLDELVDVMRSTPKGPTVPYLLPTIVIPVAARISGDLHRLAIAEEAARTVLADPSPTAIVTHGARAGLALIAVLREDVAALGELYAFLKPQKQGLSLIGQICDDRLLGVVAHSMADLDQAATHFEDALTFCRQAGYRPELAWTCCDYADTLRERDGEGDRAKAMSLLEESLSLASELGMRPLMERVLSRREILGA
ncbi:MAG: hypothetical protein BZY80_03250 [SAR202 cluster bacterium Io17-Chloro-G2]|nr:MAG: hypothetical protein BZY80_03250 [SAR202 cluster bacterium Io17-Chloro-G2]